MAGFDQGIVQPVQHPAGGVGQFAQQESNDIRGRRGHEKRHEPPHQPPQDPARAVAVQRGRLHRQRLGHLPDRGRHRIGAGQTQRVLAAEVIGDDEMLVPARAARARVEVAS